MALGLFGRRWLRQVGFWGPVLGGAPYPFGVAGRSGMVTLPPNGRIENDQHGASLCGPSNR